MINYNTNDQWWARIYFPIGLLKCKFTNHWSFVLYDLIISTSASHFNFSCYDRWWLCFFELVSNLKISFLWIFIYFLKRWKGLRKRKYFSFFWLVSCLKDYIFSLLKELKMNPFVEVFLKEIIIHKKHKHKRFSDAL